MESYTSFYFPNVSTVVTLTEEDFDDRIFHFLHVFNITIYSIMFILGTVGNGLVIWIIGFKLEKTATLIWFLNLSIADFCFCLFIPFSITEWALPHYWPFGQIMCKTWAFNVQLYLSASVLFLMIISVDRCICVLYPIWSKIHRTSRSASIISVIIWILSVALSSPYIVFYDHVEYGQLSYCSSTFGVWINETTFDEFVSMFLIPFSIILISYGLIAFQVRKRRRISGSGRTLKIIFTVVICFFLCWFLFHILHLIASVGIDIAFPCNVILSNIAYCLVFFNSCFNPIIYVFMGQDFKKNLRKSVPFFLENTFRESNDPPETLNSYVLKTESMALSNLINA
ncbi:hypothetical protein XELAEV_18036283mg [Xenopus laevis]|uniref:G-protein coupled receptors family 1 profile domain-containing protein n=1 Tax=Xenopus laevis TaxID=8355 RepID=A0A974CI18_XENLA|nr:hypothetical protein XELAEV_18036283mg [Xenopus laevis]